MRFAYLHQLFQVHDVQGVGRTLAVEKSKGVFITLDSYLDWCGEQGFELVAFTVESLSHRDRTMYVGYQRTNPTSARAVFKKCIE